MAGELKAQIIRVHREIGDGDWLYATSPDLRGLLLAEQTLEGLDKMIPQAITDLYAARNIEVLVVPLDEGEGGPRGAWVAVPVELTKTHYRKPSLSPA